MEDIFKHDVVLVREKVRYFKAANAYELFDEQGTKIGEVLEDVPGFFKKLLKFSQWKTMLSFTVNFFDLSGNRVLGIHRPFTFFMSSITVSDANGGVLGMYRQKFKLVKPEFHLMDPSGNQIATMKGDWKGWNFSLEDSTGVELAKVTKKWAGLAKEFFTSADNYVISISRPEMPEDMRKMIFAAGIGIDMALKERGR